jgi:hypothetical protein
MLGVNANAKIIEIDQGIKISIGEDHEYLQFNQRKYLVFSHKQIDTDEATIKKLIESQNSFGFTGLENTTIIAKKGFAKGYGDYVQHSLSNDTNQTWGGINQYLKNCSPEMSAKLLAECIMKSMKIDPMVQLDYGSSNASSQLQQIVNSINNNSANPEKLNADARATFGSVDSNINLNFIRFNKNKWGWEITGKDSHTTTGLIGQRIGYIIPHNNSFFMVQGFCFSEESCKNIKDIVFETIRPYLSFGTSAKSASNSSSMINDINRLNELYKSGAINKEEFEKAKKKILN